MTTVYARQNNLVRDMWVLTNRASRLHKVERRLTLESVEIVGRISELKPWQHLNMSMDTYLVFIGLTASKYSKRRRVSILFRQFPEAKAMFERGETEISHLVTIARMITKENAEVLLGGIKGKSKREVEEFAARVRPDGSIDEENTIHQIVTYADERLLRKHNRAREVMAHSGNSPDNADILDKLLDFYLKAHDPMKKAERWEKKNAAPGPKLEKSDTLAPAPAPAPIPGPQKRWGQYARKPIPAAVKHRVWLRDGGRCTYVHPEGHRCNERMMIEVDHIIMVCRGGDNSEENLRLRCRSHNQLTASVQLGRSG